MPKHNISCKCVIWQLCYSMRIETDGQTNMKQLIVVFRIYEKAVKLSWILWHRIIRNINECDAFLHHHQHSKEHAIRRAFGQMVSVLLQSVINMSCRTDLYELLLCCCRVSVICHVEHTCVGWYLCCCRDPLIGHVEQTCVRWYLCCCRDSLLCNGEQICIRWYLCCCKLPLTCHVQQTCAIWYLCCCRFSMICPLEHTCVRWYLCCCRQSLTAQNIWTNHSPTGSYYHGWVLVFWRQQVRETITEAQKCMWQIWHKNFSVCWVSRFLS